MAKKPSIFSKKKKQCPFKVANFKHIDYKDVDLLRQFVTERGKILPRRITGVSHYYQRMLKQAIKKARHVAFLPYATSE